MNKYYNVSVTADDIKNYCINDVKSTCSLYFAKNTGYEFGGGFEINGNGVYIKEIIYNNPVTIIFWSDDTKTVSKCCDGDTYNPETGLAVCVLKKLVGGKKVKFLMDDWLPHDGETKVTLKDVRKRQKKE